MATKKNDLTDTTDEHGNKTVPTVWMVTSFDSMKLDALMDSIHGNLYHELHTVAMDPHAGGMALYLNQEAAEKEAKQRRDEMAAEWDDGGGEDDKVVWTYSDEFHTWTFVDVVVDNGNELLKVAVQPVEVES